MRTLDVWVLLVDGVISVHSTRVRAMDSLRTNHDEFAGLSDEEIEDRVSAVTDFRLEQHDVLM